MKGFGRKGMTRCPRPSWWLCHPWVWLSRCSLLHMCRLLQLKADPPVLWDPGVFEVKQLAFKSHCKTNGSLPSAAGCSACNCQVCRSSWCWGSQREKSPPVQGNVCEHVKWSVRASSHLMAETWNGKHVQWARGPQALLLPRKWSDGGWSKHVNPGSPHARVFHNAKSICWVEILGTRFGIYTDRLTSSLLLGFHSCCYGDTFPLSKKESISSKLCLFRHWMCTYWMSVSVSRAETKDE